MGSRPIEDESFRKIRSIKTKFYDPLPDEGLKKVKTISAFSLLLLVHSQVVYTRKLKRYIQMFRQGILSLSIIYH